MRYKSHLDSHKCILMLHVVNIHISLLILCILEESIENIGKRSKETPIVKIGIIANICICCCCWGSAWSGVLTRTGIVSCSTVSKSFGVLALPHAKTKAGVFVFSSLVLTWAGVEPAAPVSKATDLTTVLRHRGRQHLFGNEIHSKQSLLFP